MTNNKSRPTIYNGIQMRSRLEATFAQHCDATGASWVYEPVCFADERGQYLPDFRLDIATERIYIEIKPTETVAAAALESMKRIWSSEPTAHLAVMYQLKAISWEGHSWGAMSAHPITDFTTVIDAPFTRDGDRLFVHGDNNEFIIDLIDNGRFDELYQFKLGDTIDIGTLRGVEGWKLLAPRTTDRPWGPRMVEVDAAGVVTDHYAGQYFIRDDAWWALGNICRQRHPYHREPTL